MTSVSRSGGWVSVLLVLSGCAASKEYVHQLDDRTFAVGVSVCSGAEVNSDAVLARLQASACADIERVGMTTVYTGSDSSTMCPGGWTRYESTVHCKAKKTR